jgi:hypothetical protein
VIVTFRLSAEEFKEGLTHRRSCGLCDDLAHLYMDIAELVKVRLVINDLDEQPDYGKLVDQLTRLHVKTNRRRRSGRVAHTRRSRSRHDWRRDEQHRALKIIRRAWDVLEEQESPGS